MGQKKDYYEILGVSKTATAKEIKTAYKRLARKYHPDVNKGDVRSEDKFKEVAEAFAILSDADKRATYDRGGHAAFGSGFNPFAGADASQFDFGLGNLGDLFSQFGFGGVGGGGGRAASQPRRGEGLRMEVRIAFRDAVLGTTLKIMIPREDRCGKCGGSGTEKGAQPQTCPTCGGSGRTQQNHRGMQIALPCGRCQGAGRLPGASCGSCRGSGRVRKSERVQVRVPAGIKHGGTLRVAGKGNAGLQGGPAGDLLLTIMVEADPVFRRERDDLATDITIGLALAALGGNVGVPTLNGEKTINLPAGTGSGQRFRLKGEGIPATRGRKTGDLYAVVKIVPPRKLNKRSRELMEEFGELNA